MLGLFAVLIIAFWAIWIITAIANWAQDYMRSRRPGRRHRKPGQRSHAGK